MRLHLKGERALEKEFIAFLRPTKVGRWSDHGTVHNRWIRQRRNGCGGDGSGSVRCVPDGEGPFQMIHDLLERI